jgi:PEP-CTERM motif
MCLVQNSSASELTMLGRIFINRKRKLIRSVLVVTMTGMLSVVAAHASPMDYTFTGTGGGTINGTAFTGAFTFALEADTTNIIPSGTEFFLTNVAGTFSEGGTTYTLGSGVDIVANPDLSFPRIAFFNSDFTNGLGINNSALAGYSLASAIGPITAPNPSDPSDFLIPTLGGTTGFSIDGGVDKLILTANDSLTFTAAPPSAVPEPSTLALFAVGMFGGIGLIIQSSRRQLEAFRSSGN